MYTFFLEKIVHKIFQESQFDQSICCRLKCKRSIMIQFYRIMKTCQMIIQKKVQLNRLKIVSLILIFRIKMLVCIDGVNSFWYPTKIWIKHTRFVSILERPPFGPFPFILVIQWKRILFENIYLTLLSKSCCKPCPNLNPK